LGIRNFKPALRKAADWLEAIETYLAMHAGVSPEAVDEFDRAYEAKRKAGDDSEPGDDPKGSIANNTRSARRNAPRPGGYVSCSSSPSLRERCRPPDRSPGGGG